MHPRLTSYDFFAMARQNTTADNSDLSVGYLEGIIY
jgi:hypothetical protein